MKVCLLSLFSSRNILYPTSRPHGRERPKYTQNFYSHLSPFPMALTELFGVSFKCLKTLPSTSATKSQCPHCRLSSVCAVPALLLKQKNNTPLKIKNSTRPSRTRNSCNHTFLPPGPENRLARPTPLDAKPGTVVSLEVWSPASSFNVFSNFLDSEEYPPCEISPPLTTQEWPKVLPSSVHTP